MTAPTRRSFDAPQSLSVVGGRVTARVLEVLDAEILRWTEIDELLLAPLSALRDFVAAGGKRLRPAFCHWAFVGAGGSADAPIVVDAGSALELLHTFALVHDDVMDGSDLRRGRPSIHEIFVTEHGKAAWRGEGRRFGEGSAILIGDFALMYADRLIARASWTARNVFDDLRIELCVGQYLDLVGTASGSRDPAQASRIERYKSGKYTVERPLHLGAALAGHLDELGEPLSAVGLPLGEAFQLRDDILGVFGDATVTGKPVGDDLREGKLTPLIAEASARARGADTKLLELLGQRDLDDGDITRLQTFLVESGSCRFVEDRIDQLVDEAFTALARTPITVEAQRALEELGSFVAWRDR